MLNLTTDINVAPSFAPTLPVFLILGKDLTNTLNHLINPQIKYQTNINSSINKYKSNINQYIHNK